MVAASLVAIAALTAVAVPQCPRPEPPAGGLPTLVELVVPVTYSDGYRTFASLIRPDGAPPPCGWPLVVHVHPLAQTRGFDLPLQTMIAGQGYAVWSYDVRGQGQAIAANAAHANAGSTLWGPVESVDLAEQIQFVAGNTAWTGIVDATRVAVIGSSQGGAHAWSAAAWSGRPLAVPGRPPLVFPAIACVVPADVIADSVDDWLRGGTMFSSWFVAALSGSWPGLVIDPAFVGAARAAFLAQDPAALAAAFIAEGRPLAPLLATSAVPVLHMHAYFDVVASPLTAQQRLESMQGPRRAVLSTIGHGVPHNDVERAYRDDLLLRWLHRFLWNAPNEVEMERPHVLAELPLRAVDRDDPAHLWSHAHLQATSPQTAAQRLHLHDDFELRAVPPAAPQPATILQQTIDPLATTFTPADYLDVPAVQDVQNVLAVCPLAERVWSFVATTEQQMAASPVVHLRVIPDHADWMLAALLTVQPAEPGADEVLLASHALGSRTSSIGIAETHDLRLPPIAVRIPAGATVRLRLRNLWLRELPMQRNLEVAPRFHDFRVDIVHDDVDGSWLDLPLTPVSPHLVASRTSLELAAMQPLAATLRGGTARAGFPYVAMLGLSGHVPAVPFLNDEIPIDADWLVLMSVGATTSPHFLGFLGFLDAAGDSTCTVDLTSASPLPQFLNGLSLTLTAFVWDGSWAPTGAAANPCDVLLR